MFMEEGLSSWVAGVLSVTPPPGSLAGEHLRGAWWKADVGCTS